MAQHCPEVTARLVDRWAELEAAVARPDPLMNDPATMRGLLLTYSEKVLALEEVNAALTPKAEALDRIASADGALNITAAAKALQVRPESLFSYLQSHSWIDRCTGSSGWLGYQSKVTPGLLEHKVTTVQRSDGSEKVVEQVPVTAKGLTRPATLLQPHHSGPGGRKRKGPGVIRGFFVEVRSAFPAGSTWRRPRHQTVWRGFRRNSDPTRLPD